MTSSLPSWPGRPPEVLAVLTRHDRGKRSIHQVACIMPPFDLLGINLDNSQYTSAYLALIRGDSW